MFSHDVLVYDVTAARLVSQTNPLGVELFSYQARSKRKMTGGAERVAHINSLPRFGPSVKAYFLVHVRSLHLSTIPFVLVFNFPFVLL